MAVTGFLGSPQLVFSGDLSRQMLFAKLLGSFQGGQHDTSLKQHPFVTGTFQVGDQGFLLGDAFPALGNVTLALLKRRLDHGFHDAPETDFLVWHCHVANGRS